MVAIHTDQVIYRMAKRFAGTWTDADECETFVISGNDFIYADCQVGPLWASLS